MDIQGTLFQERILKADCTAMRMGIMGHGMVTRGLPLLIVGMLYSRIFR